MATKTAVVGKEFRYDPDGAASPLTIEFPDTTLLTDGQELRLRNINKTSTTTIDMTSNSSSPLDKIEDPTDRTAAYASTVSSIVTTRYVMVYQLDTSNYANKTWVLTSLLTA